MNQRSCSFRRQLDVRLIPSLLFRSPIWKLLAIRAHGVVGPSTGGDDAGRMASAAVHDSDIHRPVGPRYIRVHRSRFASLGRRCTLKSSPFQVASSSAGRRAHRGAIWSNDEI